MKRKIKKGIGYFILGFLVLFLLRLVYGYIAYPNGQSTTSYYQTHQEGGSSFNFNVRNYATQKVFRKGEATAAPTSSSFNQKYEKVGSLSANTAKFVEDEQKVRQLIIDFNALIQFEQKAGLANHRYLHLAIGVDPMKFENMTDRLSEIGKLTSIKIEKTDKTNEYKDLNANKASLEKARESLIALKTRSGKIEELVALETKILGIEEQIQELGVKLGEFDKENEFCTVKYTLRENKGLIQNISLVSRLKTAFEWTVKYYCLLLVMLFFATFISLFGLIIIEKLTPFINKYWKD